MSATEHICGKGRLLGSTQAAQLYPLQLSLMHAGWQAAAAGFNMQLGSYPTGMPAAAPQAAAAAPVAAGGQTLSAAAPAPASGADGSQADLLFVQQVF